MIARGSNPLNAAKRMISLITDADGKPVVPVAFCTNSTGVAADKARCLSDWLSIKVSRSTFTSRIWLFTCDCNLHHCICSKDNFTCIYVVCVIASMMLWVCVYLYICVLAFSAYAFVCCALCSS